MQSDYSSFLTASGVCGLLLFSLLCDAECKCSQELSLNVMELKGSVWINFSMGDCGKMFDNTYLHLSLVMENEAKTSFLSVTL